MRLTALLFSRKREIERLFGITANAFGVPLPPARLRGASGRLREYARFTREHAVEALARPKLRADVERRLFRGAFQLGSRLRLRLRVRTQREAMQAARIVYRGLGIDFRASDDGAVVVRRCRFAESYTGEVCRLISALDRGLLAGIAYYGELCFNRRISEGQPDCRACYTRRTA